jgi:site-specific DNA-methyltransferase (adenine-specific)
MDKGRFPANLVLDGSEEVVKIFPESGQGSGEEPYSYAGREYHNKDTSIFNGDKPQSPSNYNDFGSASRFFYCAKPTREERNMGILNDTGSATYVRRCLKCGKWERSQSFTDKYTCHCEKPEWQKPTGNTHPSVKSLTLMKYLVKLITPKGGIVIDPFAGSGTTLLACKALNFDFIGIEKEKEYIDIANKRLRAISHQKELFE